MLFRLALLVAALILGGSIYYAYNPPASAFLDRLPVEIDAVDVLARGGETHLFDGCGALLYRLADDTSALAGKLRPDLASRGAPSTTFGAWYPTPLPDALVSTFIENPEYVTALACGDFGPMASTVKAMARETGGFFSRSIRGSALLIVSPERKLATFLYTR